MTQEKEVLGDPSGSGVRPEGDWSLRPTRGELYDALTELQASAAAYVQGLEAENRALREALEKIRDNDPDSWEAHIARAALKDEP
jgi:hypothetical protein